jgi:hypothetical protein
MKIHTKYKIIVLIIVFFINSDLEARVKVITNPAELEKAELTGDATVLDTMAKEDLSPASVNKTVSEICSSTE